eukprot:76069_1
MALIVCWLTMILTMSIASKRYFTGLVQMNWTDSATYCDSQSATFASIHSQADYEEAKSICMNNINAANSGCWISLNDIKIEGTYEWSDGSITDYGFYSSNPSNPQNGMLPWSDAYTAQPDNHAGTQNCVAMRTGGFDYRYDDDQCFETKYVAMCQMSPTTYPTISPTFRPTTYPTIYPTLNPTTYPTIYPTTSYNPSFSPSNSPSQKPLHSPIATDIYIQRSEEQYSAKVIIASVIVGILCLILAISSSMLIYLKMYRVGIELGV